jgi:CTP:molybdopterin cytidylyltransferase MocA
VTVAAVILAASPDTALADVEGTARVRRLADVAWSGGAVPVLVVAPDPTGAVAEALAGAAASYVSPAAVEGGPVAQMLRGIDAATAEVRETDAAILWPARLQWVDAETITSLIEAHGQHPRFILRPTYRGTTGWPVLVPLTELARLRTIAGDRMPDDVVEDLLAAGAIDWRIDLGDPGTTHDSSVARADLPPFEGPGGPQSGHHEWGDAVAAAGGSDEPAFEGPALAPFAQANESEDPALDADLARLEP